MKEETSISWLATLKSSTSDEESWRIFVESYAPAIQRFLTRSGVDHSDAEDVTQSVVLVVLRRITEFERQRMGSFRAWLRAIAFNVMRTHRRMEAKFMAVPLDDRSSEVGQADDGLIQLWNQEYVQHVVGTLLEQISEHFSEQTLAIFRRCVLEEEKTSRVAEEFGVTVNTCFIARSRVMKRLREYLSDYEHCGSLADSLF